MPHLGASVQRFGHTEPSNQTEFGRELGGRLLVPFGGRGRVLASLLDRLLRGVPKRGEAHFLALRKEVGFVLRAEERFGVTNEHEEEGPQRVGHDRPRVITVLRGYRPNRKGLGRGAKNREGYGFCPSDTRGTETQTTKSNICCTLILIVNLAEGQVAAEKTSVPFKIYHSTPHARARA